MAFGESKREAERGDAILSMSSAVVDGLAWPGMA
jgi:hypothetical protein